MKWSEIHSWFDRLTTNGFGHVHGSTGLPRTDLVMFMVRQAHHERIWSYSWFDRLTTNGRSDQLNRHCCRFATADAEGGDAALLALVLQGMNQGDKQSGTG
jgi:hypothetical protein